MKQRTVALLAAAVVAAHLVFFYLIADFKPLPQVPYIAPPNFTSGHAEYVDPKTHQKMVYSEFTVSTHIPSESHVPPPPAGDAPPAVAAAIKGTRN